MNDNVTYTVYTWNGLQASTSKQPLKASGSGKRKREKIVSKISNKKMKKCKDCKYRGTDEKLKKHMNYFCGKENNKWWNISVSKQFQQCLVKGDFGTALCRYKLQSDTFTFEIYTDIPCDELSKYKSTVHLKATNKNKAQKLLRTEYEAEHDWKLTMKGWASQDFGNNFQVKVNIICLEPEDQSDSSVENESITYYDSTMYEGN